MIALCPIPVCVCMHVHMHARTYVCIWCVSHDFSFFLNSGCFVFFVCLFPKERESIKGSGRVAREGGSQKR